MQHDEIKLLKKKVEMLREAVREERQRGGTLNRQIEGVREHLGQLATESANKDQKNEALLSEIRQLKEALITERNAKIVCVY